MSSLDPSSLQKGAFVAAAANGVINGAINYFTVKDRTDLMIASADFTSLSHSVMAGSLMLAVSLAFILTGVAYLTFKHENKPAYFPRVFMMSLWHTIIALVAMVVAAIGISLLWGGVVVSPMTSVLTTAVVASAVSFFVELRTKSELVVKATA